MPKLRSVSRHSTFTGQLNMTPMIDIVFQLLVFFMVASHLVSAQQEPLQLPDPPNSQAKEKNVSDRLMINLFIDADGQINKIKVGSDLVNGLPALVDLLLRVSPDLRFHQGTIILRADKNIQFAEMEKVLRAIANAGITSIDIAAQRDQSQEDSEI